MAKIVHKFVAVSALLLAAPLLVAAPAMAGSNDVSVTRFHGATPVAPGTITVVPADPAQAGDIEFRSYADTMAGALRDAGFSPIGDQLPSEYIATLTTRQTAQAVAKKSGMSIGFGFGGGSYGRSGGVGVGTGVSVPVGGGTEMMAVNEVSLQIKRRSDGVALWEGRAVGQTTGDNVQASLANAMPRLAKSLMRDFPGADSKTVKYKD